MGKQPILKAGLTLFSGMVLSLRWCFPIFYSLIYSYLLVLNISFRQIIKIKKGMINPKTNNIQIKS